MKAYLKEDYKNYIEEQNLEVRNMVIAGLEQVKYGKTKDFDEVCDRLEKKYRNASVQN